MQTNPMRKLLPSLLTALVCTAPAAAQSMGWMGHPLSSESLQSLISTFTGNAAPTLVVFDTAHGDWRLTFENLTTDAQLAELTLLPRWEGVGSAPAFYQREGWKPGPHWALVDVDGKVLNQGTVPPGLAALKAAVEAAIPKSRLQELRAFVAQAPGNMEAREIFVQRLRDVAQRRALAALGLHNPAPPGPDQVVAGFSDETGFIHTNQPSLEDQLTQVEARDLDADQDEDIWGEYTRELVKVFENEAWATLPFPGVYKAPHAIQPRLASPLARFSPLCQDAYRKVLPSLAALLQRFPDHGRAWQLWCDFAGPAGGDAKQLLASLEPPPGPGLDWPPVILRRTLLDQARAGGDWRTVTELAEDIFDRVLETAKGEQDYAATLPPGQAFKPTSWLDAGMWEATVAPLVEAHLAQNHGSQAEDVMARWERYGGWKGAYAQAAQLARKAQKEELAKAWEQKAP